MRQEGNDETSRSNGSSKSTNEDKDIEKSR